MKKLFNVLILVFMTNNYFSQELANIKVFDTIEKTNKVPFNLINWQETYRNRKLKENFTPSSTSFFLTKNVILTASHNIYTNFFTNIDWINIIPGKYFNQSIYRDIKINGRSEIKKLKRIPEKFKFKRVSWDFSLIYVPDEYLSTEFKNNWEQTFYLDKDFELKDDSIIHIAGYPSGKGSEKNGMYSGKFMIYQKGKVNKVENNFFTYEFYTEQGNSGSPVWIEESNGKKIVVGIHTYNKKATRLNKYNISLIEEWIKEFEE